MQPEMQQSPKADASQLSREGHRKRLREKFIKSGLNGFNDYEIIELLLTLGAPRRDCKQQSEERQPLLGACLPTKVPIHPFDTCNNKNSEYKYRR